MDFPQLPPELLLMLFKHLAPEDLLGLVKASPRCLRILESIGSSALRRLLEKKVLENTKHEEAVHFLRPVVGLNALTSLVCAKSAARDIELDLWKVTPRFQFGGDTFVDYGDDLEHPLSKGRRLQATINLYDDLEKPGPPAHVEELKSKMIKHYGPFFSEKALSAANRYRDQMLDASGHANEEMPEGPRLWDTRYADKLPVSFGCKIQFDFMGSREGAVMTAAHSKVLTFHMRACRDVVCFTTKAKPDLAHRYKHYMTLKDVETISEMLRELGVRPGAVVNNDDLILEQMDCKLFFVGMALKDIKKALEGRERSLGDIKMELEDVEGDLKDIKMALQDVGPVAKNVDFIRECLDCRLSIFMEALNNIELLKGIEEVLEGRERSLEDIEISLEGTKGILKDIKWMAMVG